MASKTNKIEYLLTLTHATSLNPLLAKKLYANFPNLAELFKSSKSTLEKLKLSPKLINSLKNPPWTIINKSLYWAKQPRQHLITIEDSRYPKLLKKIAAPPLVLFVAGNIELLNSPQIAIVGSRNPTPTGKEIAFSFAKELASSGITIISGLALGIDTKAHEGALAATGNTIAIMGTGQDSIYPKANNTLAKAILTNNGTLVTEFLIGTKSLAQHFPLRNRIISALSYGTLVVEATVRSGSLITAKLALEQNREVFAIPGSIYNPMARGCNKLIQQGAKLVETTEDVFAELKHLAPLANHPNTEKNVTINNPTLENTLDKNHKKLIECIGHEETSTELIIIRSGLSPQRVAAMLIDLELAGLIVNIHNSGYIRTELKNFKES